MAIVIIIIEKIEKSEKNWKQENVRKCEVLEFLLNTKELKKYDKME